MSRSISRTFPATLGGLFPRRHPQPATTRPRRASARRVSPPRERVLVVRGYSPRWRTLSRIQWWLRLLPMRLMVG